MQISGIWQSVIASNFDAAAAAVVCRQLGFVGGPATWARDMPTSDSQCARLRAPIHPSYCSVDIATLHECQHLVGNTPCDDVPVTVQCSSGKGGGPGAGLTAWHARNEVVNVVNVVHVVHVGACVCVVQLAVHTTHPVCILRHACMFAEEPEVPVKLIPYQDERKGVVQVFSHGIWGEPGGTWG